MNKEKLRGLIVGAIAFVLVVILFLFIGNETSTSTIATSAEPTSNNQNSSGLLMAVTFTLTLLGLIAFNHFREKMPPKPRIEASEDDYSVPSDTTNLRYQLAQARRDLQNSQREHQNALTTIKQLQEAILNLFGTTDFTIIASAIGELQTELSSLRSQKEQFAASANLSKQLTRQQQLTTRLANERNQATALLQAIRLQLAVDETTSLREAVKKLISQAQAGREWQKKAEQAQAQVTELEGKILKPTTLQELSEGELRDFFKTVTLDNEAYLSSKRRQRRLLQRFRAERIHLYRRTESS